MYMFLYGFALFENSATATATTNYSFPVLPPSLPIVEKVYNGKLIPQYIWIAVKNKEDELPIHLKNFLARNNNWKVNICDNKCKDEFMNQVHIPFHTTIQH